MKNTIKVMQYTDIKSLIETGFTTLSFTASTSQLVRAFGYPMHVASQTDPNFDVWFIRLDVNDEATSIYMVITSEKFNSDIFITETPKRWNIISDGDCIKRYRKDIENFIKEKGFQL